jgi:hypothetical protein
MQKSELRQSSAALEDQSWASSHSVDNRRYPPQIQSSRGPAVLVILASFLELPKTGIRPQETESTLEKEVRQWYRASVPSRHPPGSL